MLLIKSADHVRLGKMACVMTVIAVCRWVPAFLDYMSVRLIHEGLLAASHCFFLIGRSSHCKLNS